MDPELELNELRTEVAETTKEIIQLIAVRNGIARRIGEVKRNGSLPAVDQKVEDALIEEVIMECDSSGVDRQVGLKVLSVLLSESKRIQGFRPKQALITPVMMAAKSRQLQAAGKKLIRLDVGEPDFHPPQAVLEACSDALFSFKTHYTQTQGIPQLIIALRHYLERRYQYDAKETEVMSTPGGRFGIYSALATTVKEGESAIVIEPNWPVYKEVLQQIGARAKTVPTTMEEGWEPSVESIKEAVMPNTRAIVLSYPANPTGKIITPEKFRELLGVANDNKLTVISDEIYTDYAYKPCPTILRGGADKFILTASFSKTWAMTGFRVGYIVSSEELIAKMVKFQTLVMTSVPEFIQYGAIKALDSDREVEENARTMKERIDLACREIASQDGLQCWTPDGAMYVFPQAKKADFDSSAFAMKLLEEGGVSIVPGSGFGNYPRCFRLSLGNSMDAITEGIKKIGELLG
ncbi:MAG: aminotransferase class I/II-fold pyridoxal phosphate-dependent enzyme [Thaumarchaeota archaeon]|nr:aminotransferase class I/II-fold pyridoxal phosphate-dependent enzyme [Nitrososphaerota archaeon]